MTSLLDPKLSKALLDALGKQVWKGYSSHIHATAWGPSGPVFPVVPVPATHKAAPPAGSYIVGYDMAREPIKFTSEQVRFVKDLDPGDCDPHRDIVDAMTFAMQAAMDREVEAAFGIHKYDPPKEPLIKPMPSGWSELPCKKCGANRWRNHDGTLDCLYC